MQILKLPSLVGIVVFSTLAPALAMTDLDIAPAALVGKTLTFTIVNGGLPYASNGTWSGAFAATGNGFAASQITGDFVNVSTTYSATVNSGYTNVLLTKFVEGQKPATLTLYTISGVGHYEVSISDVFGVSLNGTFTIGSAAIKAPEIGVQMGKSGELKDGGIAKKNIGATLVGKAVSKTFTIRNSGTAPLKNIVITTAGRNRGEFTVTALGKTRIAAKESTTFKVTFKPKAIGVRNAAIHIKSNDKDENPFDIKLTGTGSGIK